MRDIKILAILVLANILLVWLFAVKGSRHADMSSTPFPYVRWYEEP